MHRNYFRAQAFTMLVLLTLQFVLGMMLNLFVTLPNKHPGTSGNNYFSQSGHSYIWALANGAGMVLLLHVLVATGLLLASIAFVVRAVVSRNKRWMWVASTGLLGIFTAFGNGLSFLDFNHDFSSFIMAMGFVVAAAAYAVGLSFKSKRDQ